MDQNCAAQHGICDRVESASGERSNSKRHKSDRDQPRVHKSESKWLPGIVELPFESPMIAAMRR